MIAFNLLRGRGVAIRPTVSRIAIIGLLCLSGAGCSIFDGEGRQDTDPLLADPCADAFNEYITQHSNGLGVTSEECVASERGEWLDGGCYCHGGEH